MPEEELLRPEERVRDGVVLGINSEYDPDPSLSCEGWSNDQEALRAANEWRQELKESAITEIQPQ